MKRHAKASSTAASTPKVSGLVRIIRGALATRGGSQRAGGSGAPSARLVLVGSIAVLAAVALGATAANAITPVVTAPTATNVEYTTAHFEGEVNPEDKETSYHFEYITDAQYLANEGNAEPLFSGASQTGAGSLPEGAGLTPVSTDLGGLSPQTVYHLRLVAENESGTESAVAASTFETKGPVVKPTIENLTISSVTTDSAHFSAEVNPNGSDPAFETNWHFECEPSCGSGAIHSGPALSGGAQVVETDAAGLGANTTYTVRLYADNSAGLVKATDGFKTSGSGPIVKAFDAGPVLASDAYINAEVNPRGSDTVYWFEWGKEDCSAPEAECQSVPAEQDASAGSGQLFKYASRHLTGLDPETTYHFRVVAKNDFGTVEGGMREFTTSAALPSTCSNEATRIELHATELPDCRAYEMVSPPDKNGGDVKGSTYRTVASAEGNAAIFSSFTAFGDAKGTGIDTDYHSERTGLPGTSGWSTHGITPKTKAIANFPQITGAFTGPFSSDLSSGVFLGARNLTESPNVAAIEKLYRVNGLDAGGGQNELLSDAFAPVTVPFSFFIPFYRPMPVDATPDLSHILFESRAKLLEGAPAGTNLYEYKEGGLSLAGVLPNGEVAPTSQGARDGGANDTGYAPSHEISTDGSRYFFQSPAGYEGGALYMREDGSTTVQINESEATTPGEPGPAHMWAASADGSRAFFTTSESLVDADTGGPSLYMWSAAPDGEGHHLTLISSELEATSVIGTSDAGDYVYFFTGFETIYLWHEGTLTEIGSLGNVGTESQNVGGRYAFEGETKEARVTPDGRHVLFVGSQDAGLVGHGGYTGHDLGSTCNSYNGHCLAFFLYDADTGSLQCASCDPSGAAPQNDAKNVVEITFGVKGQHVSHALSNDGRYVFFSTPDAVLPEDTNGTSDAYEFDSQTRQFHLLSSGTNPYPSYFLDASADGTSVFLLTREQLVGWDRDSNADIYVARVDGGFSDPSPLAAPCGGESCRRAGSPPPVLPAIGSVQEGRGNPRRPCRRGRKLRNGRCRRTHHRRNSRHHRRTADNNRRAGK